MKKIGPFLLLAVVVALLALAAPVVAKEVTSARLCGAGGCVEVRDHKTLQAFHEGGTPVEAPAKGSPWYRATLSVSAGDARDTFDVVVLPSAHLIRSGEKVDGYFLWTPIPGDAARAISRAAGTLEPFPASKLAGARPEGRHKVVVHGVVRPAARIDEGGDGFSEAWVGAAGGLLLVGAGAFGLRRRRRNGNA